MILKKRKVPPLNVPPALRWMIILFVVFAVINGISKKEKFEKGELKEAPEVSKIADTLKKSANYMQTVRGLKLEDVKTGSGSGAVCGQSAVLDYEVFLLGEEKKVISSKDDGKSVEMKVGYPETIKAIESGLIGMQEGGMRVITAPSYLAYDDEKFKNEKIPQGSAVKIILELKSLSPKIPEPKMPFRAYNAIEASGRQLKCGDKAKVSMAIWDAGGNLIYPAKDAKPEPYEIEIGLGQNPYWLEAGLLGIRTSGTRALVIPAELSRFALKDASDFLASHNIKKDELLIVDLKAE